MASIFQSLFCKQCNSGSGYDRRLIVDISLLFVYGDFYSVTSYGMHLPYHEQIE
jgi:hypothetical protein